MDWKEETVWPFLRVPIEGTSDYSTVAESGFHGPLTNVTVLAMSLILEMLEVMFMADRWDLCLLSSFDFLESFLDCILVSGQQVIWYIVYSEIILSYW